MRGPALLILALSLAAAAPSCSPDHPSEKNDVPPSVSEARRLAVVIRLPGDDFAGEEELRQLDAVARRIEEEGLGEVILTGTGMGTMEVVIRAHPGSDPRPRLREIVRREVPGRTSRIEERRAALQPAPPPAQ